MAEKYDFTKIALPGVDSFGRPLADYYQQPGSGGSGGGSSGSSGGGGGGSVGKTLSYSPNRRQYANMPQQLSMPAFMPGQMEGIAAQLSQGFGAPQQSYVDMLSSMYRPTSATMLSEPLTQTMDQWGLEHGGNPADINKDGKYNPKKYQQYGMQTGSPWLDQMFGLKAQVPGGGV
jgi:hypothetical protein